SRHPLTLCRHGNFMARRVSHGGTKTKTRAWFSGARVALGLTLLSRGEYLLLLLAECVHAAAAVVDALLGSAAAIAAVLDGLDEQSHDLALGLVTGSMKGAARGVAMAAAAEALGDARDIHVALRAQTDAVD